MLTTTQTQLAGTGTNTAPNLHGARASQALEVEARESGRPRRGASKKCACRYTTWQAKVRSELAPTHTRTGKGEEAGTGAGWTQTKGL